MDASFDTETMTVAVVDDSDFFLELLATELDAERGIETVPCESGQTALDRIEGTDVDCVLTDYQMPDIDGLDLLESISGDGIPVIMLTGKGDEDVASEAIKRGASDYITKETITEDGEIGLIANRIKQAVYQQRARDALAEKRAQLRKQNEQLEFLNHLVRHDIANELTVAGGLLQGVVSEVDSEAAAELEAALDAIENATEIADAAGDMVAVFAAGEDLTLEPVAVPTLIEREVADVQSTYPEADVAVEGDLPEASIRANEMVDSVLRNLLSNAIEHNDADDPRVRVSVDVDAEHVTLRVADNGPGIPESARAAIFDYEASGDDSSGMGIGLHLVATLVDAYDGSIRIEDNEPRGTVFVVDLPRVTS